MVVVVGLRGVLLAVNTGLGFCCLGVFGVFASVKVSFTLDSTEVLLEEVEEEEVEVVEEMVEKDWKAGMVTGAAVRLVSVRRLMEGVVEEEEAVENLTGVEDEGLVAFERIFDLAGVGAPFSFLVSNVGGLKENPVDEEEDDVVDLEEEVEEVELVEAVVEAEEKEAV